MPVMVDGAYRPEERCLIMSLITKSRQLDVIRNNDVNLAMSGGKLYCYYGGPPFLPLSLPVVVMP